MKLRRLKAEDAPLMLEWMHDPTVVEKLQKDFSKMTLDDCKQFIENSKNNKKDIHLAIVDDMDTYMGTVSLKDIKNGSAEFAITIRKCAMGKGYSKYGMKEIIRYGLEELGLRNIYWCVSPENIRACKFYEKGGYKEIKLDDEQTKHLENRESGYTLNQILHYKWYLVTKE